VLGQHLGVVYARLPGEAWELGAGYAVGRLAVSVGTPFDFLQQADNSDKEKVPTKLIVLFVVVLIAAGLGITVAEYNQPLATFRKEALRMAKGEIDVLSPSRFRGAYKKIAADLNDGIEKVAAKGGAPRRAADLQQVLGPIPAQPQMSAFSVPGGPAAPDAAPASAGPRPAPRPPPSADRSAPRLRSGQSGQMLAVAPSPAESDLDVRVSAPTPAPAPRPPPPPKRAASADPAPEPAAAEPPPPPPAPAASSDEADELDEWRRVYEEFIALKKQCGEDGASLTFEKFKGTLQRNKDALVARHGCSRVKFTVYVKEGKAALKASPVK
jgi:hypothetical protein